MVIMVFFNCFNMGSLGSYSMDQIKIINFSFIIDSTIIAIDLMAG